MESYWNTGSPNTPKLAKVLFGIIVGIVAMVLAALFLFSTHEIVRADNGEILAKNAPIQYIAPFDVDEQQFFVKEGDSVQKGDTLAIILNRQLEANYRLAQHELNLVKNNLEIQKLLTNNARDKARYLKKDKSIIKARYRTSKKRATSEQSSLEIQVSSALENIEIASANYKIDSTLFNEKIIAKRKFDETKLKLLTAQREFEQVLSTLNRERINEEDTEQDYEGKVNEQQLRVLNAEQEYMRMLRDVSDLETKSRTIEQQIRQHQYNLDRQYIIAEQDGSVRSIYNARQSANLIKQSEAVMVVSPSEKEEYFAKLNINQRTIRKVKVGQMVHLKPDAYDVLKYGPIKGKVTFVSDSDLNNSFYVLVKIDMKNLQHTLKNGFLTKADIITERIRLYEFLGRKLFSDYQNPKEKVQASK